MTQAVVERPDEFAAVVESVGINGDLAKLEPAQRVTYYRSVCESLGLNPLTRPMDYLVLNGRLTLYARKDATDQLRASRGISVEITAREFLPDAGLYVVTAKAVGRDGRTDESVGAVNVKGLGGENLANALMKAETKAKRRPSAPLESRNQPAWVPASEVSGEGVFIQLDEEMVSGWATAAVAEPRMQGLQTASTAP